MSLVVRLRAALPRGVALGSADTGAPASGLWPQEQGATARMVPARLREFAAGRRAARAAMAALGVPPVAIPMGSDRAPLWPEGVAGSISHDNAESVAVAGRRAAWAGLGIDLEPALALPEDIIATVCAPGEAADALTARAVFCTKEAAYKALYPLINVTLEFHDMRVSLGPGPGFVAHLGPACGRFGAGARIEGSLVRTSDRFAALVCLPAR